MSEHSAKIKPLQCIATCARGLEGALADELQRCLAQDVLPQEGVVQFTASPEVVYRVLLNTRLANRVLWPVCTVPASSAEQLYAGLRQHDWRALLTPAMTFCIDFIGESDAFRNSMFGAQKVKDALVDSVREGELRPAIDKDTPDIRFNAVLFTPKRGEPTVQVAVDLGNGSLHRRGYRTQAGEAPLKETVAAAILLRAGWPTVAQAGGMLFDPMCGSGTLLIEGALMAAGIPPGVFRTQWGMRHCPWHDEALWRDVCREADDKLARLDADKMPLIVGCDRDAAVIRKAQANVKRAGLDGMVKLSVAELDVSDLPAAPHGLLVCNPPYGERLADDPDLPLLYGRLGECLNHLQGWQAAVITSEERYARAIGLRSHRSWKMDNGAIPCRLYAFRLDTTNHYKPPLAVQRQQVCAVEDLPDGARMLCNRLSKNRKALQPWLQQQGISCYRVYDADLPEYAFAVDVYTDNDTQAVQVHLQEYAPPKTVDEQAAARRREEAVLAVSAALSIPLVAIHSKQRQRQKGKQQYTRQADAVEDPRFVVQEHGLHFLVDMDTYLDTGLFLDSRPIRRWLAQHCAGQRFLNLFCYTGSATVYAAAAGARSSLSIDLSTTYTNWARDNLRENGIDLRRHEVLAEDCLQWLTGAQRLHGGRFDLIYFDPPTFSNSKSMCDTLDIQRDHVRLLLQAAALLAPGGRLVFVTNFQRFRLDIDALADAGWQAQDITADTLDRDFQRSRRIHQCWCLTAAV